MGLGLGGRARVATRSAVQVEDFQPVAVPSRSFPAADISSPSREGEGADKDMGSVFEKRRASAIRHSSCLRVSPFRAHCRSMHAASTGSKPQAYHMGEEPRRTVKGMRRGAECLERNQGMGCGHHRARLGFSRARGPRGHYGAVHLFSADERLGVLLHNVHRVNVLPDTGMWPSAAACGMLWEPSTGTEFCCFNVASDVAHQHVTPPFIPCLNPLAAVNQGPKALQLALLVKHHEDFRLTSVNWHM